MKGASHTEDTLPAALPVCKLLNVSYCSMHINPWCSSCPKSTFQFNSSSAFLSKTHREHTLSPRPAHTSPLHPLCTSSNHSSPAGRWQWRMGQPATGTLPTGDSYGCSSRLTAGATCQVAERLRPLITWVTWPPWCRAVLGVPCMAPGSRRCHRDIHRHLIFNQVSGDDGWWICPSQIGRCWIGGGKISKWRSDYLLWRLVRLPKKVSFFFLKKPAHNSFHVWDI